jgi:hypothetical protein
MRLAEVPRLAGAGLGLAVIGTVLRFGSSAPLWLTLPVGFLAACLGGPPARTWITPLCTRVRQRWVAGLAWVSEGVTRRAP